MDARNTALWEVRLNMIDGSRKQYRGIAGNLANENETLRDQLRQTEKDTIDVVTLLKKQDLDKDSEIEHLQQEINDLEIEQAKDKQDLLDDFDRQKYHLNEKLTRKENELDIVRHELNQVKEFRKKKGQMQKELEEIKDAMLWNVREQKETLEKLEQKFSDEKMRLQQESNKRIEEIAEHAQNEALKTLDEKARNIYKENVDLIESLRIYKRELDALQKLKEQLRKQATTILSDKEMNDSLIKEKIEEVQKNNKLIKELKEKVQYLEISLTKFIEEFDIERKKLLEQSQIEHESSQNEIIKLQRALELKGKEMNKVKKLGKTILEQRSEIETLFLDALQNVKRHIIYNRLQYHKDAFNSYQNRMLNIHHGQGDHTRMKTFNEAFHEINTSNVFHDLEETTKWTNLTSEVNVADLTWEQKEQVLRELFIRMNTRRSSMTDSTTNAAHLANDGHPVDTNNDNAINLFLTQTTNATQNENLSDSRSNGSTSGIPKLPQISSPANT
ncbi:unnamed protein product [Rotaria sordida]|nr:unnamed protein product [Rotaria sordida]